MAAIFIRCHSATSPFFDVPIFLRDFEQPAAVNYQRNHGFYGALDLRNPNSNHVVP